MNSIMKMLVAVALVAMAAIGAMAQRVITATAVDEKAEKSATWLEREHDFGRIAEDGGKVPCSMRLVNTTDSAIAITEVRLSCGCTQAEYPHRPIAPGDTATISLKFNPYGRPGEFEKHVVVRLSASPRRTVLKIKGTVTATEETVNRQYPFAVGSLRLNNGIALFGETLKTQRRNAYINGYNAGRDSLRAYTLDVPENLSVSIVPDTVPPGGLCTVVVHLEGNKSLGDWGPTEYSFNILAEPLRLNSSTHAGIAKMRAIANIKDDFSHLSARELEDAPRLGADTDKVDFGTIGSATAKRTLTISNSGKRPLEMHRIVCSDTKHIALTAKKMVVKPGKSVEINLEATLPADSTEKILNSTITIYSNDPRQPLTVVRLVGVR